MTREDAIKVLRTESVEIGGNAVSVCQFLEALDMAVKALDAVPVVRCRECKHYDTADFDGNILCGCTLHSAMLDITPDSFCSYGEKKEGADNEP